MITLRWVAAITTVRVVRWCNSRGRTGARRLHITPQTLIYTNLTATTFWLRLDRDTNTDFVSGLYSLDGTNWVLLGASSYALMNPQVAIWAGSSPRATPNCDLRRLDMVTTVAPISPALGASPQHLFFNAIAGQACTNVQQVRVIARNAVAPDRLRCNQFWFVAVGEYRCWKHQQPRLF